MEKYIVECYIRGSLAGYQSWYFQDEAKARDKRSDLLCRLPQQYCVDIRKVEVTPHVFNQSKQFKK